MNNFWMKIEQTNNGFYLSYPGGEGDSIETFVLEDGGDDSLDVNEALLANVLEILGLSGSRYDKERLVIRREKGDKYEGK